MRWGHMIDEDREELLERRLSEKVASRVESQVKRRYGIIVLVFAAIAGLFGYSLNEQISSIQTDIKAARDSLTDFTEQLGPIKQQVNEMQRLAGNLATLETDAAALEARIEDAKAEQANFLRRQSEIVARNVGATLDIRRPQAGDYFEEWSTFASENDFADLEIYLLTKLAQNRAYINDIAGAKLFFDRAETKAETLGETAKLEVLLSRAVTETDQELKSAALTTLRQRALEIVEDQDHFNLARVWREIGNTYQVFGEEGLALSAFEKAARNFELADRQALAAQMYRRIGDLWLEGAEDLQPDRDAAITAYARSAELANYDNDPWEEHFANVNLANLYLQEGNQEKHQTSVCAAAIAAGRHPALRERIDVVRRLTGDPSATFEEYCT